MLFRPLRFIGSLRVAAPLLVLLAGVLAWGTLYETRFGTASVQRFIYQSVWFQGLLGFLAVNLATAAWARFPWQRKHLPFVLAHVGIISILLGGIVGGRLGVEGQLIIPEGEASSTLELAHSVIAVHQPNPGIHREFPAHFDATAWNHHPHALLEVPLQDRVLQVVVDRYYPNAVRQEEVLEGGAGEEENPALRVHLSQQEEKDSVWLFARHPDRFGVRWGEAHLLFLEPATAQQTILLLGKPKKGRSDRGRIRIHFPDLALEREMAVPARMNRTQAIPGTPYQITFRDYFPDFALSDSGPVSRSREPNNPAVSFVLSGPEGKEAHLLFALHPEFAALHGRETQIHAHPVYHPPGMGGLPPDSIALIRAPTGELAAVLTSQSEEGRRIIRPLAVGQGYVHESLGYSFQVDRFFPRAVVQEDYRNRDNEVKREAVHLVARDGEAVTQAWLPFRGSVELPFEKQHPVVVEYRPAVKEMPFSVRLLDFRKIDYPGTEMAAGFESDVELADPERGVVLKRRISMNNPLKYRGYSLFQSSFVPGSPETTILSVRKDPGVPLVYTGFLVVVAGILGLFFREPRR